MSILKIVSRWPRICIHIMLTSSHIKMNTTTLPVGEGTPGLN